MSVIGYVSQAGLTFSGVHARACSILFLSGTQNWRSTKLGMKIKQALDSHCPRHCIQMDTQDGGYIGQAMVSELYAVYAIVNYCAASTLFHC